MPDSPADLLTAAATQLRTVGDHRLANDMLGPIADWLGSAARRQWANEEAAKRVWPDPTDHQVSREWLVDMTDHQALAVARQILGEVTE